MALKLAKKKNTIQKINKKPVIVKKTGNAKPDMASTMQVHGTYIEAVGRRKTATARVRIYPDVKGEFNVNGKVVGQYFTSIQNAVILYQKPLEVTGTIGKFAITVVTKGSGISSQLQAVVHGLSRALCEYNGEFRPLLKNAGLLTRDDRMKETRKVGRGGKARRKRQSPKR